MAMANAQQFKVSGMFDSVSCTSRAPMPRATPATTTALASISCSSLSKQDSTDCKRNTRFLQRWWTTVAPTQCFYHCQGLNCSTSNLVSYRILCWFFGAHICVNSDGLIATCEWIISSSVPIKRGPIKIGIVGESAALKLKEKDKILMPYLKKIFQEH